MHKYCDVQRLCTTATARQAPQGHAWQLILSVQRRAAPHERTRALAPVNSNQTCHGGDTPRNRKPGEPLAHSPHTLVGTETRMRRRSPSRGRRMNVRQHAHTSHRIAIACNFPARCTQPAQHVHVIWSILGMVCTNSRVRSPQHIIGVSASVHETGCKRFTPAPGRSLVPAVA